ncbi:MAG: CoA transferase [Acidimicrobiia bacterium]|nr:CoA transferase [Acidimicrobiia bacterium]
MTVDRPDDQMRPLDGLRVLDFSRVLAGPHCGRMLRDLGAEVIKIEPPAGDLTRFSTPRRNGLASYFVQQNVGKRNLSIDLSTTEGVSIVLELVEHVDVILENYRPGVMDRLGLGYDTVRARNQRVVYASISGYGQTGPWVHRRAYAPVVEAETGVIANQGRSRPGPLTKDPLSHADAYTGVETASAILAALYQRERTGRGQRLDVSMAETMMYVNDHSHDALWDGEDDPGWIRSFRPDDYLIVEVADGESLIISGHPAENGTFELLAAAMERSDLLADERFGSIEHRLANLGALREIVREYALTVPDADEFERRFSEHSLAVGRVRAAGDLAATAWGVERGVVAEIDDRAGGTIKVPNVPWRFADGPGVRVDGVAKYRGEDNRAVLIELLGYDDDRLDALEHEGVLSSRIPSS